MFSNLKLLYSYRDLFWTWTLRNIKVRYKQSILGGAWAIFQPLALMLLFSVIFTIFVKIPTGGIPYPIFSYSALLPWTFFSTSLGFAIPSLVTNMGLITKIYFPREILPFSEVASGFLDYMIALLVFIGMMVFYHTPITPSIIMAPLIIFIQVLLTLGIVLLASALNVFYRDIRFVVPLLIQLWFYATPIIYPISTIPEGYRFIYMINPMAGLIESYRSITLLGEWPDWISLISAATISLFFFIAGYSFFKRVEWQFADII